MLNLNIQNEAIRFKNIVYEDYDKIYKWYNMVEEYKYATGNDIPIDRMTFKDKINNLLMSDFDFFVGIYNNTADGIVGILNGGIKIENHQNNNLWINIIVIDMEHQKKGIGMEAIKLTIDYFYELYGIKNVFLAVVEENYQGIRFWEKLGFKVFNETYKKVFFSEKIQNVIIMKKAI